VYLGLEGHQRIRLTRRHRLTIDEGQAGLFKVAYDADSFGTFGLCRRGEHILIYDGWHNVSTN
jgi:hypothetical protein